MVSLASGVLTLGPPLKATPAPMQEDPREGGRGEEEGVSLCSDLDRNTWPVLNPGPRQLTPVRLVPVWATCTALRMSSRAWDGCMAISHQIAEASLPFLETRYAGHSLPRMGGGGRHGGFSDMCDSDCLHFTGNGEAGYFLVKWSRDGERHPEAGAAGRSPDAR